MDRQTSSLSTHTLKLDKGRAVRGRAPCGAPEAGQEAERPGHGAEDGEQGLRAGGGRLPGPGTSRSGRSGN